MPKKKPRYNASHPISVGMNFLLDFLSLTETFSSLYPQLLLDQDALEKEIKSKKESLERKREALKAKPKSELKETLEYFLAMNRLQKLSRKSGRNVNEFAKSIFVSCFSRYDAYITDIIRFYYSKSDLLLKSDRALKFADLASSSSTFAAVKKRYIDEEIEKLRKSRFQQLEFLAAQCKLPGLLESVRRVIPDFIEASERRNIVVHHAGRPTNRYYENLKKYGIESNNNTDLTGKLKSEYVQNTFKLLFFISIEVLLHSLTKTERERQLSLLHNQIFIELLRGGQPALALTLIEIEERYGFNKDYCIINKALCQKEMGDMKAFAETSTRFSTVGQRPLFQFAIHTLNEDFQEAASLVKSLDDKKELDMLYAEIFDSDQYLFKEIIKSKLLREAFTNKGIELPQLAVD